MFTSANITNEELSMLINSSTGYRRMELIRAMVKRMDVPCIFNNEVIDNEVHRLVVHQLDFFLDDWESEDYEGFGYECALESVLDILFDSSLLPTVAITPYCMNDILKHIPACFEACL